MADTASQPQVADVDEGADATPENNAQDISQDVDSGNNDNEPESEPQHSEPGPDFGKSMTSVLGLQQHRIWDQRASQTHQTLAEYEEAMTRGIVSMAARDVRNSMRCMQLQETNMATKSITPKVLEGLIAARVIPTTTECLDLSNNPLGKEGMQVLKERLLAHNCVLVTLRLSCCGLANDGAMEILSEAIVTAHALKNVSIARNDLQASHIQLLADGLDKKATSLKTLDLSGNIDLTPEMLRPLKRARIYHITLDGGKTEEIQLALVEWEAKRKLRFQKSVNKRILQKKIARGGAEQELEDSASSSDENQRNDSQQAPDADADAPQDLDGKDSVDGAPNPPLDQQHGVDATGDDEATATRDDDAAVADNAPAGDDATANDQDYAQSQ